jgi:hypothetical protein
MEGLWQGASAPKRQSATSSQRLNNSLYGLVSTAASRPIVKISSYSGFTHHDCNRRALIFLNEVKLILRNALVVSCAIDSEKPTNRELAQ